MRHEVLKPQAQIRQPLLIPGEHLSRRRRGKDRHYGVPPPSPGEYPEDAPFRGAVGSVRATSSPVRNPSIAARLSFSKSTLIAICSKPVPFFKNTVCLPSFKKSAWRG